MRWQRMLAWGLALVGVPFCILLIVQVAMRMQSTPPGGGDVSGNAVGSKSESLMADTPQNGSAAYKGTDIGGSFMLDPQGDIELARRVIGRAVESGTAQVVLSRRVVGGELPCLGFGGITHLLMRPTDMFGLVVLRGTVRQMFPGGPMPPVPDGSYESYSALLYDERYGGISGKGSPYWAALRGTFGGPDWPIASPMYLSQDGQPSMAELDVQLQWPIYRDLKVQDLHVAQTLEGWTVTVAVSDISLG